MRNPKLLNFFSAVRIHRVKWNVSWLKIQILNDRYEKKLEMRLCKKEFLCSTSQRVFIFEYWWIKLTAQLSKWDSVHEKRVTKSAIFTLKNLLMFQRHSVSHTSAEHIAIPIFEYSKIDDHQQSEKCACVVHISHILPVLSRTRTQPSTVREMRERAKKRKEIKGKPLAGESRTVSRSQQNHLGRRLASTHAIFIRSTSEVISDKKSTEKAINPVFESQFRSAWLREDNRARFCPASKRHGSEFWKFPSKKREKSLQIFRTKKKFVFFPLSGRGRVIRSEWKFRDKWSPREW